MSPLGVRDSMVTRRMGSATPLKRLKEDVVDPGERGGAGADADGEGKDGDGAEGAVAQHHAEAELDVAEELIEPEDAAAEVEALAGHGYAAEGGSGAALGLCLGQAFGREFIGFEGEVGLDFFGEV